MKESGRKTYCKTVTWKVFEMQTRKEKTQLEQKIFAVTILQELRKAQLYARNLEEHSGSYRINRSYAELYCTRVYGTRYRATARDY